MYNEKFASFPPLKHLTTQNWLSEEYADGDEQSISASKPSHEMALQNIKVINQSSDE